LIFCYPTQLVVSSHCVLLLQTWLSESAFIWWSLLIGLPNLTQLSWCSSFDKAHTCQWFSKMPTRRKYRLYFSLLDVCWKWSSLLLFVDDQHLSYWK
jgi:hypothetical protein